MASIALVGFFCLLSLPLYQIEAAQQIGKDYSFSYNAGDSAKFESSDQFGEIQGSYQYIDDAGDEKSVRYAAGSRGFTAEGDNIVNVPRLVELIRARDAVEGKYVPTPEELAAEAANADKSYSLAYHAGDSSRSEVSHPNGYVTGQYSYLDAEGQKRTVTYEAGPGIGFRVKGDHIHSQIADNTVPTSFSSPDLSLTDYTLRSSFNDYEPSDVETIYNDDGSVTYSYSSSTGSRTETVSRDGSIRGSYTFTDDRGRSRTVHYTGGRGTGFQVSGDGIHESSGRISTSSQATSGLVGRTSLNLSPQVTYDPVTSLRANEVSYLPSVPSRQAGRTSYSVSGGNLQSSLNLNTNQLLSRRRVPSYTTTRRRITQVSSDAARTADLNRILGLTGRRQTGFVNIGAPGAAITRTTVSRTSTHPQQYRLTARRNLVSGHGSNLLDRRTVISNSLHGVSGQRRVGSTGTGFIRFSAPGTKPHNFRL